MTIIDTPHRLSLRNIERAASLIDPVFLHSPQYECEPLSQALGAVLTLKVETLNPLRSFKGRGADFFLKDNAAALAGRPLVCATAGNWGQAMAYACRARGWPLVVYTATTANAFKVERMRAMGAEVRLHSDDFDTAKEEARRFCASSGALLVEDGLETQISEGAGTIARELLARDAFDALLVPLGNGALLNGMGLWTKAQAPATRVIGVCAEGADAMAASWKARRLIERPATQTIADGIAVRRPVPQALDDMQGLVDDVLLVSDAAIRRAMHLVFQTAGLMVEPAGIVGVAAVMEHPVLRSQKLATVLCGSNLTPQQIVQWLH
ncbi:threonine ammonia-lyase [Acidovorax sp. SUPP950]|uniref:threonine ammonia-lyase n=1 Tax=Acidovorax sp. SUPP950 TaxID=511901 RepID=UPI0023D42B2E|nr:threonine/serine dehydratase [Acidovorax sp. SUPP950]GKS73359.1 threonine ammonia-lyase [Acidovorax sp. SUPP950]